MALYSYRCLTLWIWRGLRTPIIRANAWWCVFNPVLSQERGRKREDLLQATEKELDKITKQTADELPVHSFQRLLADLATRTLNSVQPTNQSVPPFNKFANPALLQQRAFDLLEIRIQPPAA
jgi:hypothetical protein